MGAELRETCARTRPVTRSSVCTLRASLFSRARMCRPSSPRFVLHAKQKRRTDCVRVTCALGSLRGPSFRVYFLILTLDDREGRTNDKEQGAPQLRCNSVCEAPAVRVSSSLWRTQCFEHLFVRRQMLFAHVSKQLKCLCSQHHRVNTRRAQQSGGAHQTRSCSAT